MNKNVFRSNFIIVLAAVITALFSVDTLSGNIMGVGGRSIFSFLVSMLLVFYLAFLGYTFFVSRFANVRFESMVHRDALTYIPFFVLALFPLKHLVPIGATFQAFSYLPSALLFLVALSLHVGLKVYQFPKKIEAKISMRWVYAVGGVYFVVYTALSVLKHYAFYSTGIDLGIYDQVLFGYAQGELFFSVMRFPLLGMHVQPILFVLVPFYQLFQSPVFLLVLQSFALAFSVVPLYLISKRLLKNDIASLLVAVAFLLFPTVGFTNLFDFHPITLAIPLVLYAAYFLELRKYKPMFIFLFLAGLMKETVTLLFVAFGVYLFLGHKQRKMGMVAAAVGSLWFLVDFFVVMPLFATGPNLFLAANPYFGETLGEAFLTVVTRPIYTLQFLLTFDKIGFLILLFAPLGFLLPILGWPVLLLVVSEFGLVLLYNQATLQQIVYHHPLLIVPFLFVSAVFGMVVVSKKVSGKNVVAALSGLVFVSSLVAFISYGPFALLYDVDEFSVSNEYVETGKSFLADIPGDAVVAAPNWVMPHLSQRKWAFTLRHFLRTDTDKFVSGEWPYPEYIILDLSSAVADPKRSGLRVTAKEMGSLFIREDYGIVRQEGSWFLLERGADFEMGVCAVVPFTDKDLYPYVSIDLSEERLRRCADDR